MFSIILPVYNVEPYLDRCIQSILEQKVKDIEIILVDDGSIDNSPSMCDEWSLKDSRIKVIHKKNEGLGKARNTGLNVATKEYVFFLDSDDYIKNNLLEEAKNKIDKHKPDVVFWGFSRVNSKGEEFFSLIPKTEEVIEGKEYIMNNLLPDFIARNPYTGENKNIRISAWNCCIKRSILNDNKIQFVSEREFISEDVYFYLQIFPVLNKVCFINKALYCYCQNQGSLSFSYKTDRYKRIRKFYHDVNTLANSLNYDGSVQFRLTESYIATTMACLKMEAANYKNVGIVKAHRRIKNICMDDKLQKAVREYPLEYYSWTWKVFFMCVKIRCTVLLFALLYLQYKKKGI